MFGGGCRDIFSDTVTMTVMMTVSEYPKMPCQTPFLFRPPPAPYCKNSSCPRTPRWREEEEEASRRLRGAAPRPPSTFPRALA